MRTLHVLLAAAVLAFAHPGRAQTATLGLALESGVSASLGARASAAVPVALSAIVWLDGDVEAVFRLSSGAAPATGGRAADPWASGTAGLRWSLPAGRVRPQLFAELGWATAERGGERIAAGLGAGLELFLSRDVALAAACALRRAPAGAGLRLEPTAAIALYF